MTGIRRSLEATDGHRVVIVVGYEESPQEPDAEPKTKNAPGQPMTSKGEARQSVPEPSSARGRLSLP